MEARSGQQGAALGGLMIPPGCLGDEDKTVGDLALQPHLDVLSPWSMAQILGVPVPLLGGPAWRWRGDSTPLPELLQLGSGLLGVLPSHS